MVRGLTFNSWATSDTFRSCGRFVAVVESSRVVITKILWAYGSVKSATRRRPTRLPRRQRQARQLAPVLLRCGLCFGPSCARRGADCAGQEDYWLDRRVLVSSRGSRL